MALLPAHQRLLEHDIDEDLTDEQVWELLDEAERGMRAEAAAHASTASDAPVKLPKLKPGHVADAYLKTEGSITRVDPSKLISETDRALANSIKKIEDPVQIKKQKKEEKKATAGPEWFHLPRADMTPELRRDLQLLKMRNVLDPKRHYKKSDSKSDAPPYMQVGTVIEGPTEYYNSRINKKERKQTFLEEVLAQEEDSGKFKRKYSEIATSKASGKKGFYKAQTAKRRKGKSVIP